VIEIIKEKFLPPQGLCQVNNRLIFVRRAKALFFSGCESRPVTFVPTGSNWSSRGGNESAEASGVEGPYRDLANVQAVI